MDFQSLTSIVRLGEDSARQFKVDINNANSLAAEMAAFANAEGGVIFIGIADNGDLVGLTQKDVGRINQLISNSASQLVRSPLNVFTENIALENGRIVIALSVPKGIDKPYFDKNGIIWLRCGSDKRKINSKEELRRVFQSVDQFHADELPTKAGIDKLDKLRFRDFLRDYYQQDYPEIDAELSRLLQNLNLATDTGMLNLAGLLLFAERPEWIKPQFMIKAIRYPGNEIPTSDFLDSEDFSGPMDKIFKDALAFIMRNLYKVQTKESINYPGEAEIPASVFEELLVNALSHRDYLISAPIRLFVFNNRIEIISPGHLPNNLTIEKIKVGNSNIRNPILVSYIAKGILPYRGLGSGIKRALDAWSDIEFKDDRDGCMFSAIVYRDELVHSRKIRNILPDGSSLVQEPSYNRLYSPNRTNRSFSNKGRTIPNPNKSSEKIIALLRKDQDLTIAKLAEMLQLSTRAIEKQLANLKKANRIRRIGSNKTGFWEVIA